jgi:hypothetical protein
MNRDAEWPLRGPSICITNISPAPFTILAEDGTGRMLQVGERYVQPGKRSCFRWPFIHELGRINVVQGQDTVWGNWFKPWAAAPSDSASP